MNGFSNICLDNVFPECSAVDTRIEHVRVQTRILRHVLPGYSNSEVYRSAAKSKYQEIGVLKKLFFNPFIG